MTHALLAPPIEDATRRQFLTGLAAVGLLAGCGSEPTDSDPGPGGSDAFPVAVVHKYGETVIPVAPQRVVSVGFTDHDALLALGVVPFAVGVGEQSSLQRSGVWPWAHDRLGTARPEVLDYLELNVEAIAALEPDLITGFTSGMTEAEYGLLSRVAPTVAQLPGFPDYFAPWQEVTAAAGRALGRPADARRLVDGVEQRFSAARRDNPTFDGAAVVYAGVLEGGFYVENSRSPRVAILTSLGFTTPAEIDALAADGASFAEISEERLGLFDGADVVVWETGDPVASQAVAGSPVYQRLVVAQQGRDVFVDDELLAAAMAHVSVLSLPTVLELLVLRLAAAIDGDPTTVERP